MTRLHTFTLSIASVLLLLVMSATAVHAADKYRDKVIFKNTRGGAGSTTLCDYRGEKIIDNVFSVSYKIKGVSNKLIEPTWKLFDIEVFKAPGAYKNAKKSYHNRKFGDAITAFETILADRKNPDYRRFKSWLWNHCMFYNGMSHYGAGNYEQATIALAELTAKHGKTRFQAEALYTLADAYGQQSLTAEASATLETLRSLGATYGPEWTAKADMLDAEIKFVAEDWISAGGVYRKVAADLEGMIADAPQLVPMYTLARQRIGESLINAGDRNGAKTFYQSMERSKFSLEQAVGLTGSAEILLGEKRERDALFKFLKVYMVYNRDQALRIKSMSGAGRAFAMLYKREKFEGDKESAVHYATLLQDEGQADAANEILSMVK